MIKFYNRYLNEDDIDIEIDGEQCTRSRGNGCDYCKSHQKRLPHGRIDDDTYVKKSRFHSGDT